MLVILSATYFVAVTAGRGRNGRGTEGSHFVLQPVAESCAPRVIPFARPIHEVVVASGRQPDLRERLPSDGDGERAHYVSRGIVQSDLYPTGPSPFSLPS